MKTKQFLQKMKWMLAVVLTISYVITACTSNQISPVWTAVKATYTNESPKTTEPFRTKVAHTREDPTHTSTDILTRTPTLSPTIRPTKTSTLTPVVVNSLSEARALIKELLKNNGGCKYPCFFGRFLPGKTRWEEIETFLYSLYFEISSGSNMGVSYYRAKLPTSQGIQNSEIVIEFQIRNKILEVISLIYPFSIEDLMREYGAPKEIWINIIRPNYGLAPYHFVLFYPENGFHIFLEGSFFFDLKEEPDIYTLCETTFHDLYVYLDVWAPQKDIKIEDVFNAFNFHDVNFQRLENVSNFDAMSYYQAVISQDEDVCIVTDAEHWP